MHINLIRLYEAGLSASSHSAFIQLTLYHIVKNLISKPELQKTLILRKDIL